MGENAPDRCPHLRVELRVFDDLVNSKALKKWRRVSSPHGTNLNVHQQYEQWTTAAANSPPAVDFDIMLGYQWRGVATMRAYTNLLTGRGPRMQVKNVSMEVRC